MWSPNLRFARSKIDRRKQLEKYEWIQKLEKSPHLHSYDIRSIKDSYTAYLTTLSIDLTILVVFHMKNLTIFSFLIDYRNRVNFNNSIQKDWVQDQKSEKEGIHQSLKDEEAAYAQQTEAITRMRGLLEDEMTDKKNQQLKDM